MPASVAIKVSAEFADSVRKAADAADRSLTGQIEHWAKIGRALEAVIPGVVADALKRCAGNLDTIEDESMRRRVLEALNAFRTVSPKEKRKLIGLDKMAVLEADPQNPEAIIRVEPDGTRTTGKIVGRIFVPVA